MWIERKYVRINSRRQKRCVIKAKGLRYANSASLLYEWNKTGKAVSNAVLIGVVLNGKLRFAQQRGFDWWGVI